MRMKTFSGMVQHHFGKYLREAQLRKKLGWINENNLLIQHWFDISPVLEYGALHHFVNSQIVIIMSNTAIPGLQM